MSHVVRWTPGLVGASHWEVVDVARWRLARHVFGLAAGVASRLRGSPNKELNLGIVAWE